MFFQEFLRFKGRDKHLLNYTMSGHGAMGHHIYYLLSSSPEGKYLYLQVISNLSNILWLKLDEVFFDSSPV